MLKIISIILALCMIFLISAAPVITEDRTDMSASEPEKAENAAPVSEPETGRMYGIGSVGKVFAAAAVMKLVDEGKVDIDNPLTDYIPDFTLVDERYTQITPRMLLNHSSGLPGTTHANAVLVGDNDTWNHDNILVLLKEQTLKHEPGARSIYCNDGWELAEILVERVSGMSYTEFIERNFSEPLGLDNIKSPQSDFDRSLLADIYLGNNELKPLNPNVLGSGGLYSSMEDLCKYSTIFMDDADGSILSKESVNEMAKNQHQKAIVPQDSDTVFNYGLGWDSVDTYPFNQLGIKALSKGGNIGVYNTNLTVLPEYNIAAAVSSSGQAAQEQLIAQEIILAVLKEEGLIPEDYEIEVPEQNLSRASIPEETRSYEGVYDAGMMGLLDITFTEDSLIVTPILTKNERPMTFIYNTDGYFVSEKGDSIGFSAPREGMRRVTKISFAEDKYLVTYSYESSQGLSTTAMAMPLAQKIDANSISGRIQETWTARNDKEYMLVSEKYTSYSYISPPIAPIAKIQTDSRIPGYVGMGIYESNGASLRTAKIVDENTALGYQDTPTMMGRDTNSIYITNKNGVEYLNIDSIRYIDSSSAKNFSEIGNKVIVGDETVWVNVGESGGRTVNIETPSNGAWFAYDDKMNCVATSNEKNPRNVIILPDNGRLAFAGEPGAGFSIT